MRICLELGKARIALLSTLTTVSGYLLGEGGVTWTLLYVTIGVYLLASGSSGLNQIQERDIDAEMERTRGRPLPSGRVGLSYAVAFSVVCVVLGALVLLFAANRASAALGLLAVGWYNGVYTPLKRVTAFAAVAGGVVGAIPPVLGWTASGGSFADPRILAIAFFFFMWQVPHFWLLLLFSCGMDYERAGLPSLARAFTQVQIARITFVWIAGTATACVLMPLFGAVDEPAVIAGLFLAGLWLVWRSANVLGAGAGSGPGAFRAAFRRINAYALGVISLLSVAGWLG